MFIIDQLSLSYSIVSNLHLVTCNTNCSLENEFSNVTRVRIIREMHLESLIQAQVCGEGDTCNGGKVMINVSCLISFCEFLAGA